MTLAVYFRVVRICIVYSVPVRELDCQIYATIIINIDDFNVECVCRHGHISMGTKRYARLNVVHGKKGA